MANVQTGVKVPDALQTCTVITGRWMRWVGVGNETFGRKGTGPDGSGYDVHRFNDSTRTVRNVTEKEYLARKSQLRPEGIASSQLIVYRFDPEIVRHSKIPEAKSELLRAGTGDIATVLALFDQEERRSLRPTYEKVLKQLGAWNQSQRAKAGK